MKCFIFSGRSFYKDIILDENFSLVFNSGKKITTDSKEICISQGNIFYRRNGEPYITTRNKEFPELFLLHSFKPLLLDKMNVAEVIYQDPDGISLCITGSWVVTCDGEFVIPED